MAGLGDLLLDFSKYQTPQFDILKAQETASKPSPAGKTYGVLPYKRSLPQRGRGTTLVVDEESIVRIMFVQTSEQVNLNRLSDQITIINIR